MKPPNIKAPKCTLFSIQCFIFQGQRSQALTVLPRLIVSIVGGSLLWRAHFESLRVAEAKNAATINRLMSERQSVLYFPYSTLLSRVKGHKGSPVLPQPSHGTLTSIYYAIYMFNEERRKQAKSNKQQGKATQHTRMYSRGWGMIAHATN